METASADGLAADRPSTPRRDVDHRVWGLPRSRGPIPTERLAVGLAAHASEIGGCTYRSVRFALAQQGTGLDQEPA